MLNYTRPYTLISYIAVGTVGTGTLYGNFLGNSPNASEVSRQSIVSIPCKLGFFTVVTYGSTGGSGEMTFTMRIQSADTQCVIIIPALSAEGAYYDYTHFGVANAGDTIGWRCVNNSGVIVSCRIMAYIYG